MSASKRVQQWLTFHRAWWLFDAKWQDPYKSAYVIKRHLLGEHKPISFANKNAVPYFDTGDHVVIINTQDIALRGDEWFYRVYFHHSTFPGSKSWTKAWEVHKHDPTMVMKRAVYGALGNNLNRRPAMQRLHLYKDSTIPSIIKENITDQIRPLRPIPRRLDSFPPEEVQAFPKLFEYPKDYVFPTVPTPAQNSESLAVESNSSGKNNKK